MNPVQFYKCLSDETRLRMLLLIVHETELCVCELTEALGEIQPKISRHLALLKKGGVIQDRRQGQWIYYRLSPELLPWAQQVLADTLAHNTAYIQVNLDALCSMGNRPERQTTCC